MRTPTQLSVRRHRTAFTIIELLTVIATIAILAAIIIPVVGQVRESAARSQCSSNLRQITLSAKLYANENKGNFLPPVRNTSEGFQQWMFNSDFLELLGEQQTHKTADLADYFHCPTAENNGSLLSIHYGMNITGLGINGGNYKQSGYIPSMRVDDHAKTIYFIDGLDWWINGSRATVDYGDTGESSTTQSPAYRHDDAANVAFFDGHIELIDRTTLIESPELWRYRTE